MLLPGEEGPNIAHVEFYPHESSRMIPGLYHSYSIGTAIRFFDEDGTVTKFMEDWKSTKRKCGELSFQYPDMPLWKQIITRLYLRLLLEKERRLKEEQAFLLRACTEKRLMHTDRIAIKVGDSYKIAQDTEVQELLNSIKEARSAMLILMKPNSSGPAALLEQSSVVIGNTI